MKINKKAIEAPSDIVTDTALILQRVGVVCGDYFELSNAVHDINAQYLIDFASDLFFKRKQTGLITLSQLLGAIKND